MRYFYTIYTNITNGVQNYIITDDFKRASAARAQGTYVLVGFSPDFPGSRRF